MMPFNMQNMGMGSNYYIPMQTFDMCSGTLGGSLNLQMNACWDDLIARQNLYNVPICDFGNFTSYGMPIDMNSSLLNPMLAVQQVQWTNNNNVGGFGNFNMTNGFNPSFGNFPGMNGFGNFGDMTNFGNTNLGNNSNSSPENVTAKRKIASITGLINKLKEYDDLTSTEKDELEKAIKASKKSKDENGEKMTPEKKFKILQDAYNNISKETRKAFLLSGEELGSGKKKINIADRLIDCGHEFENANTDMDDNINSIHETISKISPTNGNVEGHIILGGLLSKQNKTKDVDEGPLDILDLISSWNTTYGKSSGSEKRLITYIAEYYNNDKIDDEQRATAKRTALDPIVNCLISKAKSVKSSVDSDSAKLIDKAIEDVTKALNNSDKKIDSNLSTAFDKLYILTREGALTELRKELIDVYGDIDPEIFNDSLFETEMIDDLKGEGFNDINIKETNKIKAKQKTGEAGKTEGAGKTEEKQTPEQQAKALVEDGILEKPDKRIKIGNTDYTAYVESKPTGSRNYKRVFVLTKDGLKEAKNVRFGDGKYTRTNEEPKVETKITEFDSIKDDYDNVEIQKKLEAKESDGKTVMKILRDWTTDNDCRVTIKPRMESIDKDNVYYFLKGAYANRLSAGKDSCGCEGIIEKLDDDTSAKIITMDLKRQMIQAFIDKADEMGYTEDEDLKLLKEEFAPYTAGGDWENSKNFRHRKSGFLFWGTNYDESMDECMYRLVKKMYDSEKK